MRGTFQARGHSTSAPFGQGWPRLSCRYRFGCVPTPRAILDRCPEGTWRQQRAAGPLLRAAV